MSGYPTDPRVFSGNSGDVLNSTLRYFAAPTRSIDDSEDHTNWGSLGSVVGQDTGGGTKYPYSLATRFAWERYLKKVKSLDFTLSFEIAYAAGARLFVDDLTGSGILTSYSAARVGTHTAEDTIHPRRQFPSSPINQPGLFFKIPDNAFNSPLRTNRIDDALTITDNAGDPTGTRDLFLELYLFNAQSLNLSNNVLYDQSDSTWHPAFWLRVWSNQNPTSRAGNVEPDTSYFAGTCTVEGLGTCNLFTGDDRLSCTFSATIDEEF